MADSDSTVEEGQEVFAPFKWHYTETEKALLPGQAVMSFAGKVRDIAGGVGAIVEIIEHDVLVDDCGGRRLFDDCTRGQLLRLAIQSMQMLSESGEDVMKWAYKHHTPEGIAERAMTAGSSDSTSH